MNLRVLALLLSNVLKTFNFFINIRWFQAVEIIQPYRILLYELEGKEFSINRHLGLVGIVSVADLRISRFGELLKMDERVNFALKPGPSGPAPPHSRGKTGPHRARQLLTHAAAVPAVHLAPLTDHRAARNRRNAKSIGSIFRSIRISLEIFN